MGALRHILCCLCLKRFFTQVLLDRKGKYDRIKQEAGRNLETDSQLKGTCKMKTRYAGVLLPITALPSPYGVGTFGVKAREFIDFLVSAGQSIWQVLPLVPTGYGDSPYSSICATAGNCYLIDIDSLVEQGLLTRQEAENHSCEVPLWDGTTDRVNYEALFHKRIPMLKKAFARFDKNTPDFQAFLAAGEYTDFAIFMALKEAQNWRTLSDWDEAYRTRDAAAMAQFRVENQEAILFWQFTQYEFFRQWQMLKEYANEQGIQIMGDMPLYVSGDSVEVWAYPTLFLLDSEGKPAEVAGVPPDYFAEDGQLWGNPLYNWEIMKADGYTWWTNRLKKALKMYDLVRIDHFRGFDRFYAVPAGSENARNGRWCDGPKEALFEDKKDWHIVAEDLGVLDEGVYRLMENTGYPGMKVLEFAFDGDPKHQYKPSNCGENCVIYTGTHDNATLMEYLSDLPQEQQELVYADIASECEKWDVEISVSSDTFDDIDTLHRVRKALIQIAYLSKAKYVIIPLQDILGTGGESRLNCPGTLGTHNWSWRYPQEMLTAALAEEIRQMTLAGNR